ncbi:MAG: respiratory nitrate reductase subunit gamma [Desulfobacterales bacterium]|nr:respiratory nitrate reductase subunit gamma [Desulfobacterales bacterium]
MNAFIDFIMGPMVWISFSIFILGVLFRFYQWIRLTREREQFIFTHFSFTYGFRSVLAWLIPFFPKSTRIHPVFYTISYLFHLLIFLVPIFLLAHVTLLEESMQWSWITLSDPLADGLTLFIIGALIFFSLRRLLVPEVKFLTRASDFLFIGLVALPFVTGFLASQQVFAYQWMTILHILSGELMIILIPFTRFSHMLTAPFTRAYTGSEFGKVRHARDW